jgi:hypothetical protein
MPVRVVHDVAIAIQRGKPGEVPLSSLPVPLRP